MHVAMQGIVLAALLALAAGSRADMSADFLTALRQGGYIIYMRHGPTDKSQRPIEKTHLAAGTFDLDDCSTQRNLHHEGRERLTQAGGAIRALHVPIGPVLASRYCRTMETARLLGVEPEAADDLTPRPDTGEKGRADALRARLRQTPPARTNTLIVAHGGIMMAVEGMQPDEGEALIFVPAHDTEPHHYVARMKLDEWAGLAARLAPIADSGPSR